MTAHHPYFAYGSNLALWQMKSRCPECEVHGLATLAGHSLTFAGRPKRDRGGVLTVVPAEGRTVPGVVYLLSSADLDALDACEGYPYWYQRKQLAVQLATGEEVEAWTYYIPEGSITEREPDPWYFELIRKAYRELGLGAFSPGT